jgi:hypothetical protein
MKENWGMEFQCSYHRSPPLVPVVSQIIPAHISLRSIVNNNPGIYTSVFQEVYLINIL